MLSYFEFPRHNLLCIIAFFSIFGFVLNIRITLNQNIKKNYKLYWISETKVLLWVLFLSKRFSKCLQLLMILMEKKKNWCEVFLGKKAKEGNVADLAQLIIDFTEYVLLKTVLEMKLVQENTVKKQFVSKYPVQIKFILVLKTIFSCCQSTEIQTLQS